MSLPSNNICRKPSNPLPLYPIYGLAFIGDATPAAPLPFQDCADFASVLGQENDMGHRTARVLPSLAPPTVPVALHDAQGQRVLQP